MAPDVSEARIVDLLRDGYERNGYAFIAFPSPSLLPSFMSGYRPDAIAVGKDRSIAIEIALQSQTEPKKQRLADITRLFEGQQDWSLRIVSTPGIVEQPIPAPTAAQIAQQLHEIEALLGGAHTKAALLLAWAAIEAIARRTTEDEDDEILGPEEALSRLETLGKIDTDRARALRPLLTLRSRIAHGDVATSVSPNEVLPVLEAARAAMVAA